MSTIHSRHDRPHPVAHAAPGAGIWRAACRVIAACGIALLLAVLVAWILLRFAGDARQATEALRSARPWMIVVQIATLGLLWHYWPDLVAWVGRRRGVALSLQSALVRGRAGIFMVLAACELLIVLRALLS